MKLKTAQFCNLSTSPAFQAWLYNNYPQLFNELITHLRSSRGCASNSQKMLEILQKLDQIPNGMITLIQYLSKEFPFIIMKEDNDIIPSKIEQLGSDSYNTNAVFEFYDSEALTYPHKAILTAGDILARINQLAIDKQEFDHIIVNGVGYVEYLNKGETTSPNSWEIRKYRVTQNPIDGPIRVGFIYPTFAMGGVEQYTISMCKALQDKVQLSGLGLIGNPWYGFGPSCVELSKYMPVFGGPNNDGYVKPDAGVIQLESDDKVIDNIMNSSDVIIIWAVHEIPKQLLKWHGKLVTIVHGGGKWTDEWLNKIVDKCHVKVAVSNQAAETYDSKYNVNIIPAGIDLERIAPSDTKDNLRKKLGIDGLAIGYIGRFSSEKNCDVIAKIIGAMDNAIGVFHGIGWWVQDELINNLTRYSNDKIKYFGPEYNTGDILGAIDCLIVASDIEGGPMVAIEAWMCGVPLVSTNVGIVKATTEIIGDVSSMLKLKSSVKTMIKAVEFAVSDEFKPTVEKARKYAMHNYNIEQFGDKWFKVLSEAVK